ncbi:adenylate kinase 8-like isoform X2 [Tubulanus polymorphus]|uniref:adenylate kinase 8-like isoform X2 n=1 Tax=Tubulanus polymorphus TaxID=672921 RepID=UPI003DA1DF3E
MDQTKRPLRIPPQFATYAESHEIFDMCKRLLEQVTVNKPEDPIDFMIELLKRENDDIPQIILLGPPAAGKYTMAKQICSKLRTAHLNLKTLVQDASQDMKRRLEELVKQKQSVPTSVWVEIIKERIQLFDCVKKGWVLEGFPQNREQALALVTAGIYPKHCEAPDTVLIERAAGKRVDPKTGDVYHVSFDWPTSAEVVERLEEEVGNNEEELVEKLMVYHRHIEGIVDCFQKSTKFINADQPKSDVFSQVITFLQSQRRSAAPHNPRVVLLGPTGCGKAGQAALLASKYNIVNVSMGQLIKQCIVDETSMGTAIKPYIEKEMLVPDALVLNILKDRLSQLDCVTRGWVLHGYPRTREQAEQLTTAGFIPNRVFFMDVPNDSIIERLSMLATDPITGERYHLLYNPPRTQQIKNRLVYHPKNSEKEVKKRLTQYHVYVEEIADFYTDGQHLNADQDPHTVFECIESMLVEPLPKKL